MQRLIDGYRRFHSHVFPQKRRFYAQLADGQTPRYLFITCSDSRVLPHEFTQSGVGDLFIDRSIGNLVPAPNQGEHEAAAVIEYAVVALKVRHIIICGHANCGAMKALLQPDAARDMPAVAAWLANAEDTREVVARKYGHLQGDDLLNAAIRENVLVQLDHLRMLPAVADRLEQGLIDVHGWVYEFARGEVHAYDPSAGRFAPLAAAGRPSTAKIPAERGLGSSQAPPADSWAWRWA